MFIIADDKPVTRRGHTPGRAAAEWVLMTGLAFAIVAAGGEAGFYLHRAAFDDQGRRFAEATADSAMRSGGGRALRRSGRGWANEGCFGAARLELFNPAGLVFADYTCELGAKGALAVANMRLRRDPDDWKITAFYLGLIHRR